MSERNSAGHLRRIGRFEILDEVGRGGTARVYRVLDPHDGKQYALKAIPNDADDRNLFLVRFHQEFDLIKRLDHTHIIQTYEAGQTDEFVYFVMEYIPGGTFRDLLPGDQPLPVAEAVDCAVQVALALAHAHTQGIVHRDVKPSNILIRNPNEFPRRLVLTDFGTAKVIGERGVTKSGMTIGTPEYMAPEQAQGSEDIDGRADIYALGCVLFEALASRPPFVGSSALSILYQQVHASVPILRGINGDVSPELEAVVERMLAKRPEDRYTHAEEVVDHLKPFLGDRFAADIRTVPVAPSDQPIARLASHPVSRPNSRPMSEPISGPVSRPISRPVSQPELGHPILDAQTISTERLPSAEQPNVTILETQPPNITTIETQPPVTGGGPVLGGLPQYPSPLPPLAPGTRTPTSMPIPSRAQPSGPHSVGNFGDASPYGPMTPPAGLPHEAGPPPGPVPPGWVDRQERATLGPAPIGQRQPTSRPVPGTIPTSRPIPGGGYGGRAPTSRPSAETPYMRPRTPTMRPRTTGTTPDFSWSSPGGRKPHRKRWLKLPMVGLAAGVLAACVLAVAFLTQGSPATTTSTPPTTHLTPKASTSTSTATATTKPTATTVPATTVPTTTTVAASTSNADKAAAASFKAITVGSTHDKTCSAANQTTTFASGQAIYVNVCASETVANGSASITLQRNGQVVWTFVSGKYISPGSSYFYYSTSHFAAGSYKVVVTMQINGQTGTAKTIPITVQ